MEYQEQIEKLRKLKELAERGEGGEQENAKRLLEVLLRKYGLEYADLSSADLRHFEFKYNSAAELQVIYGCISKNNLQPYIFKRGGRNVKAVGVECTAQDYTELRPMVEWHLANFAKEIAKLARAYQVKHELWDDTPPKPVAQRDCNRDDLYAIFNMAKALGDDAYQAPLKRLGEED